MIKKCDDIQLALMEYRASPLTGSMKSPSELLFNRRIRTKLPIKEELLKTENGELRKEQLDFAKMKQKWYYDKSAGPELKELKVGDSVWMRLKKGTWKKATIKKKVNPRSFEVEDDDGWITRRNRRHIRKA